MSRVQFFSEKIAFKPRNQKKLSQWLDKAASVYGKSISSLNYIFCSDKFLLEMNQTYLGHDAFTDVITFEYDNGKAIEGEIFISVQRVKENALKFKVPFDQELRRVLIHGLLHLLDFKDKTSQQKARMRQEEEACLSLWN